MSDLTKDLLTQYYGIGSGTSSKKFLSIHQSVENVKNVEEKQVTDQTSSVANEENASDAEPQRENEDNRKLSTTSESYSSSQRIVHSVEDVYDTDDVFDLFDIDFGPNIMCNTNENRTPQNTPHESLTNLVTSDYIKTEAEDSEIETSDRRDSKENDLTPSCAEDHREQLGNVPEVYSAKLKSPMSSENNTHFASLPIRKREPVYNQTFADFFNTDLNQFPYEILYNFSQLRMLYLSNNNLIELPEEIFTALKYLEWFDVRNNKLTFLPTSIKRHGCLETILLQGNKLEHLPLELCTLPNLKTLQVAENPLIVPPKDIVASGCARILEFLRTEWNNIHPEEKVEPKENKIEPKLSTILCYQSPRMHRKKIAPLNDAVYNKNMFTREKRISYKPSNRCENTGANVSVEQRLFLYAQLQELFAKQTSELQKMKDKNVLKEWRRDRRSYNKAIEKAMKRNEDDIPFGIDVEDYATIFAKNSKPKKLWSKKKGKHEYLTPTDLNKKINELLESLNKLETKVPDETTPRTKQNLFRNEIGKLLEYQNEIQDLRKYDY